MFSTIIICISVLVFILICLGFTWRFLSNRQELPCPSWLGWLVEQDNPFTKTNQSAFIIKRLQLEAGMHVLDAGCGPGRLTIPIAKEIGPQGKVTALDIQSDMLERVKAKAKNSKLDNIDYLQSKIGDGNLQHCLYDRALLITVLGEIPKREEALKEIFYALKPGGILVITEIIFDPHFQKKSTVLSLINKVGFQEVDTIGGSLAYSMLLKKLPEN